MFSEACVGSHSFILLLCYRFLELQKGNGALNCHCFLFLEGFQSWMWKGLTFLLPFLFFGHVSTVMMWFTLNSCLVCISKNMHCHGLNWRIHYDDYSAVQLCSNLVNKITIIGLCVVVFCYFWQIIKIKLKKTFSHSSGSFSSASLCSEWLSSQTVKNGRSVLSWSKFNYFPLLNNNS